MNRLFRRYPGVAPFETAQADQYFGRERDIQDLHNLILLEKLVVLFGKSGYGKSSLLNAGIVPQFGGADPAAAAGRPIVPLAVKFTPYTGDQSKTPVETVINALGVATGIGQEPRPNTLWLAFKQRQKNTGTRRYVLLFDQFEEFFTYLPEQQREFAEQLAELLYTEIPQSIRRQWDGLSESDRVFFSEELDVKAVIAIREDRLSWLDGLKNFLPTILYRRYELTGLTDEQARLAIRRPAALPTHRENRRVFAAPAFTYTEEAEQILLDEIKREGTTLSGAHRHERRIEAFLLQICCEEIERRLIERVRAGDVRTVITPDDLPRFDGVYEAYYKNKIDALPLHQREAARLLIEEELIEFNAATGVVFRLNADGRKLCLKPGITEDLLKKLTDSFLLRSEPNTTGGFNYEISHDRLVGPVLQAKELRLTEQARRLEEQARIEREKELAEERRKRRRARTFAAISFLLAALAIVASIIAMRAQQGAIEARDEAEAARKVAEQRLYELQKNEAMQWVSRGDQFVSTYQDEPEAALYEYGKALEILPGDSLILARIARCSLLIDQKNKR